MRPDQTQQFIETFARLSQMSLGFLAPENDAVLGRATQFVLEIPKGP
ncbi:MAG: hypothetical protein JSS54_09815 [Proteobacteria bacterium]|nr:hypothetical protein [Pseudomonadota bacterium]